LRLDELGQHFDITLEHQDVDSISGLVLALLGRPPLVGDVVDYGRLRLQVTQLSGLGAGEVRAWLVD
jgi:CBS domain containing-hemolysin-like protein